MSEFIIRAQLADPALVANSLEIRWGLKVTIDLRMCPMVTHDYGLDGFPALFVGGRWLLVDMVGSHLLDAWHSAHRA